ncbi:TRAP transporter small permease [Loktanella sp. SALINAS62]|uniref:TRAP transporter small permease n=1 Tax=Loktanella sp. SALINAS62 TaxID=2706124 RepID=UPI001B8AE8DD|nr:TRAP transporter small permease [Loktanella sp. SALINAS62]MBS1304269.1 TRAP transporter small permease [Loktanella sp. SALINAS62]
MPVLLGVLWPLERLNGFLLMIGRIAAVVALAVMVVLILGQVFFRYVLNDAPNWTEEAARFGMLWMTGLMAPVAYRRGGFVSIDMLGRFLPRLAAALLSLVLLSITMWVLLILWERGLNNHIDTMSGRGRLPALRLPLDLLGGDSLRFRNWWMFASLWVGINLLILVNLELMLRQIVTLLGGADRLRPLPDTNALSAE